MEKVVKKMNNLKSLLKKYNILEISYQNCIIFKKIYIIEHQNWSRLNKQLVHFKFKFFNNKIN